MLDVIRFGGEKGVGFFEWAYAYDLSILKIRHDYANDKNYDKVVGCNKIK